MAARKANNKLIARLNALQEERGGGFNIDAVALIVEEAVASALNKMSKSEIGLRSELEQLSDIIRSAKAEIG